MTKYGRDEKIEFILGILEVSLNLFGIVIDFDKKSKRYKAWYKINMGDIDTYFLITDSVKDIFKFCSVEYLYNEKDKGSNERLFDQLAYNKYFNKNLITPKSYKYIKSKFNLNHTTKLLLDFYSYIKRTDIGRNYIFSNYENIYIKSIDNFFNSNIEQQINNLIKRNIEEKFNYEDIRHFLAYAKGYPPNQTEIENFMDKFKEYINLYGSFGEYILNSTKEDVYNDLYTFDQQDKLENLDNLI